MKAETLYNIVQFVRTLLPIFAAVGTISSAAGFWKMFQKWNKPGILSLVPFVRGWIFGQDSPKKARLANVSGEYFDRSIETARSSELSYNNDHAKELWSVSMRYAGLV